MYLKRIRKGVVNPQPIIKVDKITSAVAKVDGNAGMGFLAGHKAMDVAMDLCRESGIGMVGVHNSTHYGMAALYVMQAMKEGFIAMAHTNSSPAIPPSRISVEGRGNRSRWHSIYMLVLYTLC